MMETQEVDYAPPDAFRKIGFDEVIRDRDNPVGYLSFQGREESLYKEKTVLGRDSDSDIVIDSPQISRHHATFKANPKQNAIFICVYGKNNYLNGVELDPELFYQVTDGSLIDFRSVKMKYKSNNNPAEIADENTGTGVSTNSAENKENHNLSQKESSPVESTHGKAESQEAQDENTQFEDDVLAPSPEAEDAEKEGQENLEDSHEENKERKLESTHDKAESQGAQHEEENTQFEDNILAPSPEAEDAAKEGQENLEDSSGKNKERKLEEEVVDENTLKIPFEDNPFLEDSQLNFAKPSGSGFKLRRLPSFESQEQLVSEMETQPLDFPLNPPYASKKEAASDKSKVADSSKSGDTSGDLEEDTQMSLEHVELRVSLEETQPPIRIVIEDTQPINTITLDSQTQASDNRERPKVRKTLSYEEPKKTSDIMVISSDDEEDEKTAPLPGSSRATEIAAEPEIEISPVVMRRRRTATASDTGESLVGSAEQLVTSSTPQLECTLTEINDDAGKEKALNVENAPNVEEKDENIASEEESDGIVEASDEDEPTAKRFFVKDTQEISADGHTLDTSAGIINETQEDDTDSINSNNITAVEVEIKGKEGATNTISQDNQGVINESLIEEDHDAVEVIYCEKSFTTPANGTQFASAKKRTKRISKLSLRRSTSPQKPIQEPRASTSRDGNTVTEKECFETNISQESLEEFRASEQSQDEQVSIPEVEKSLLVPDKHTAADKGENISAPDSSVDTPDVTNKHFESLVLNAEENVDEAPAAKTAVEAPEKTDTFPESPIVHAAGSVEKAPSSDDESLKKVELFCSLPVNVETPKAKKLLQISRERSPDPDISIAEEVKMSPRLSKIAAAERLESPKTATRAKLNKSAAKLKTDIKKQSDPKNSLEPNDKMQDRAKSKVPADEASDSEPGLEIFIKPRKQTLKKVTPQSTSDKGSESDMEIKPRGRGRPRSVRVVEETTCKIAEQKLDKKRSAQVNTINNEEPKAEDPPAKSPRKSNKIEEMQTAKTKEPHTALRRRGRKAPELIDQTPLSIAAPSHPRKRNAKVAKSPEPENAEALLEPPAKSPRKGGRSKDRLPVESVEAQSEPSAPAHNNDELPLNESAQPESEGRPKRRRTLARKMQESMESVQRDTPKRKAAVKGGAKKEVTPNAGTSRASKATKAQPSSRSTRRKETETEEKTENDGKEAKAIPPLEVTKPARKSRAQKVTAEAEPQTGKTATNMKVVSSPSVQTITNARASRKDSFVQNAPKKGRQSTTSSSVNSSDSQSRTRTKTYVFFSGFESSLEKEVKLVTKLGGFHKDDVPDKKHKGEEFILVVNGSFKRTLKVIDIIGHGAPIVSENWLRACEKEDAFVDAWDYILQDKAAEKKFGFNLRECLTKAKQTHDVFASWSIYFTPNVKPSGAHLKKCVEALGGKYLATKPRSWPANNLMVVSCEEDEDNYRIIMKSTKNRDNVPCVTVQGLFECMQQQKIVSLDKFILK